MADRLSPESAISPTPSIRRSTSTSDTIETVTPTPPEPIKTKSPVLKSEELPPDYEHETPPPSYPTSLRDAEGGAPAAGAAPPKVRKRWFKRHLWWCTLITIILVPGIICAGVFGSFCSSPDSGCYLGHRNNYGGWEGSKPDNIPPTSAATSTGLLSPTATAYGEKNRLVYTNVGGQRPIVGSSITVVSEDSDPDTMRSVTERVFFHDTYGQLYESSAYRGDSPVDTAQNRAWRLDRIPGAIMAVNTSIAASKINYLSHIRGPYPGPRRYNDLSATAIFFHAKNGTIMRILSPWPGSYENIKLTPYTNSGLDDWEPLAVTQLNTTDGYKLVLAYYDNTSPGNFQDAKGIKFVDGWWDRSSPYDGPVAKRQLPNLSDLSNSVPEHYKYPVRSPLLMQKVKADDGQEGFILAYQIDNAQSKEDMLSEAADRSADAGASYLATRYDFFVWTNGAEHPVQFKAHTNQSYVETESQFPSFALWPNLARKDTDEEAFSVLSCSKISCDREFFSIHRTNANGANDISVTEAGNQTENVPEYEVKWMRYNGGTGSIAADTQNFGKPVVATSEGLMYVVDIKPEGQADLREYMAGGPRKEDIKEMGRVPLWDAMCQRVGEDC